MKELTSQRSDSFKSKLLDEIDRRFVTLQLSVQKKEDEFKGIIDSNNNSISFLTTLSHDNSKVTANIDSLLDDKIKICEKTMLEECHRVLL